MKKEQGGGFLMGSLREWCKWHVAVDLEDGGGVQGWDCGIGGQITVGTAGPKRAVVPTRGQQFSVGKY